MGGHNIRSITFIEDTDNDEYCVFPDPASVTLPTMTAIAASTTLVTEDVSSIITRTNSMNYSSTGCTFTLTISPPSVAALLSIDQATKILTLQSFSLADAGIYTATLQTVIPPAQVAYLMATPTYNLNFEVICQVTTLTIDNVPTDFVQIFGSGPYITPD